MIPYFTVWAILAVFALLDIFEGGQELRKKSVWLFFLILFAFAAFRGGDQDYSTYVEAFKESMHVNVFDKVSMQGMPLYNMELGYRLLNKIVSSVTDQPIFIFMIMAFIALSVNFHVYRKYSPYVLLSILLYFSHPFLLKEMIQIRMGVACAICLYSLCYVEQRRWGLFVLFVLIAGTVHTTALAFLVVYPLYRLNIGRKIYVLILSISLLIALLFPLGQLFSYLSFLPFFEKINLYINYQGYNETLGVFTNPTILKYIILTLVGLYFFTELTDRFPYFPLFFLTYILGTCWSLLFNDFSIVAARISSLFAVSEVIIIPMYFYLLKNNLFHRLIFWCVLVGYCFITLAWNIRVGSVLPYQLSLF